ncbi:MAG: hypothetical protein WBA89_00745 [Microcoleus sp.]|uniref:hypothetical protein n=1 Tax=Microcoleus sp. TaxID=44472 RepID=UPI003C736F6F
MGIGQRGHWELGKQGIGHRPAQGIGRSEAEGLEIGPRRELGNKEKGRICDSSFFLLPDDVVRKAWRRQH